MNPRARPPPLRIITIASNLAQTFSTFFFFVSSLASDVCTVMQKSAEMCENMRYPEMQILVGHPRAGSTYQPAIRKLEKMESICSGIRDKFRVKSHSWHASHTIIHHQHA